MTITKVGDTATWAIDGVNLATVVDNVRVIAVPEPSALAMGALGFAALLLRSSRSRGDRQSTKQARSVETDLD